MSIEMAEDWFVNARKDFDSERKDLDSAEEQAARPRPRLAKTIEDEHLKQALQVHLERTTAQAERLDRAFGIPEKRAGGKTCEAAKGLLEEACAHSEEIAQGPILKAALIGAPHTGNTDALQGTVEDEEEEDEDEDEDEYDDEEDDDEEDELEDEEEVDDDTEEDMALTASAGESAAKKKR